MPDVTFTENPATGPDSGYSMTRKARDAAITGVAPVAVLLIPASFPEVSSELFTSRVSTATCVPVERP